MQYLHAVPAWLQAYATKKQIEISMEKIYFIQISVISILHKLQFSFLAFVLLLLPATLILTLKIYKAK